LAQAWVRSTPAARATNVALWVLQAVLAGLLVGATTTNLFILGESASLPIGLLLVSALIARAAGPGPRAWPAGSSADRRRRRSGQSRHDT
jgi:hypothetical protein